MDAATILAVILDLLDDAKYWGDLDDEQSARLQHARNNIGDTLDELS